MVSKSKRREDHYLHPCPVMNLSHSQQVVGIPIVGQGPSPLLAQLPTLPAFVFPGAGRFSSPITIPLTLPKQEYGVGGLDLHSPPTFQWNVSSSLFWCPGKPAIPPQAKCLATRSSGCFVPLPISEFANRLLCCTLGTLHRFVTLVVCAFQVFLLGIISTHPV